MKPLKPARWTEEDTDIWLRWQRRHGWRTYAIMLEYSQLKGDRRDAELMWHLIRGALMQQDLGDGTSYFQARGPRNWHLYKAAPLGEVPI